MAMKSADIIEALGGPGEVAKLCKVRPQAVSQWYGTDPRTGKERHIPKARLMYLEVVKHAVLAGLEANEGA
jgi:hypothetical protein